LLFRYNYRLIFFWKLYGFKKIQTNCNTIYIVRRTKGDDMNNLQIRLYGETKKNESRYIVHKLYGETKYESRHIVYNNKLL